MKFISAYATEPLSVFDLVKIKETKNDIVASKYKKGKPSGISTRTIYKIDDAPIGCEFIVGHIFSVLQKGVIPHREEMNYRLNDEIYAKDGQLTLEKTKYKVGKVIPQGIYLDFLQ